MRSLPGEHAKPDAIGTHVWHPSRTLDGFGYEVVLMRRYRTLCEEGTCSWLLVYAPNDEQTQRVADIALRFDALTAVKYNRLVEEDLL